MKPNVLTTLKAEIIKYAAEFEDPCFVFLEGDPEDLDGLSGRKDTRCLLITSGYGEEYKNTTHLAIITTKEYASLLSLRNDSIVMEVDDLLTGLKRVPAETTLTFTTALEHAMFFHKNPGVRMINWGKNV